MKQDHIELLKRIGIAVILAKDVPAKNGRLTLRVTVSQNDYLALHDVKLVVGE